MDKNGFFGNWGGAYIPEVLHQTFQNLKNDPGIFSG
jgi:tryptophan synthase beta chain